MSGCSEQVHYGQTWVPRFANEYGSFYTAAKELGLTADPAPDESRPYVLVHFDDRPGALEVHYRDELEFL